MNALPGGIPQINDLNQSVRQQITVQAIIAATHDLIRMAIEIPTGSKEADDDMRAFADSVYEALEDRVMKGACWELAANERARDQEREEKEWDEWRDHCRHESNRVRL